MENDKKTIKWYYHPILDIRMMTCTQRDTGIEKNINLAPHYSDNFNIGIVIESYNNFDDVKKIYDKFSDNYKILIHDDKSANCAELEKIFNKADIEINEITSYHNLEINISDQSCIFDGLQWAVKNKIDILIKINPSVNINQIDIDNLKYLAIKSDGITFSRPYKFLDFDFDIFAMNVNAWTTEYVKNLMSWYIQNKIPVVGKYWYHELAKQLDYQNFSKKYEIYKKDNFKSYMKSGYVDWNLIK